MRDRRKSAAAWAPPAAAYLLTDRLPVMIGLSLVIGAAAAVLGHAGALAVPAAFGYGSTSTAGMIAVAAGVLLLLAVLLGPRHGVLSRRIQRAALRHDAAVSSGTSYMDTARLPSE